MNDEKNKEMRPYLVFTSLVLLPVIGGFVLVVRWMIPTLIVLLVGEMTGLISLKPELVGVILLLEIALGVLMGLWAGMVALRRVTREKSL